MDNLIPRKWFYRWLNIIAAPDRRLRDIKWRTNYEQSTFHYSNHFHTISTGSIDWVIKKKLQKIYWVKKGSPIPSSKCHQSRSKQLRKDEKQPFWWPTCQPTGASPHAPWGLNFSSFCFSLPSPSFFCWVVLQVRGGSIWLSLIWSVMFWWRTDLVWNVNKLDRKYSFKSSNTRVRQKFPFPLVGNEV